MEVIAANIIDFIAAIIQVGSGAVKKKSRILKKKLQKYRCCAA